MKIVLISVENTLVCFGIRMISAVLKQSGHDVRILFVPREFNHIESSEEIEKICGWIKAQEPDLLGVSLMSSHWRRVTAMHPAIRSACDCPIIWGGIHPTLSPEECLKYADLVCVGEGEEPILELVQAMTGSRDYSHIPGIWLRNPDGTVNANPPSIRKDNLSLLPYPDHDESCHTVFHEGKLQPIIDPVWRSYIPGFMDTHYVMSSRGCPHDCTYCCNSALRTIAGGPYLRRRSPEHFIGEMLQIKNKFPNLKGFVFMDDSFFYGDQAWFRKFSELYRIEIGLPFLCWANPVAVTRDRIDILVEAGLVGVHVGLESGSPRISKQIYRRKVSQEQFYKCMSILHDYRSKIVDIRVDVITDNPYESDDETAETVRVLSYLKKPFFVGIVSLIFYPKTSLEQSAVRDGLVSAGNDKLYNEEFFRYRPTMLNRLMRSVPKTPGWIIRYLLEHRNTRSGRVMFHVFYWGYFIAIRRSLLRLRRYLTLTYIKYMEKHMNPTKVVTTRVSLIDF